MNFIKKNKTLFSFSGSSILLSLAKLIANILIINWLLPEQLGIWNTIVVVKSYAVMLNLGTTVGLNRELPFALGKNMTNIAKKLAETGLFISILAAIISFLLISNSIWFVNDGELQISIIVLSVLVAISFINMYFGTTFRTNQAFLIFSRINLLLTIVEFASLILPAQLSYEGFLFRIVGIELIKLILFLIYRPYPVKPKFSKFSFLFLISTGVPLFISVYISSIAETFKRVILKNFSSFEVVGLFSPALAIHSLNTLLPNILGKYIFPKLNYSIGKGNSIKSLWNDVIKFVFVNMLIMIPLVIIGWLILPTLIESYFPKYTVGIYAAKIALLSALFIPFRIIINLFNTLKSWKIIYMLTIFKVIIYFCFQWFFTKNMEPLTGIAYGILASDAFFALAIVTTGLIYIRSIRANEI